MGRTWEEQRKEGNHEHKEDASKVTLDPIVNRYKVVTPYLPTNELSHISILANEVSQINH